MNINQNYNCDCTFNSVNISKATKRVMHGRGELEALEKVLPEFERKGKKANITIYAVQDSNGGYPLTTYGISIRPQNTLKDNVVTRFLGLSNNRGGGDSFISVNSRRADEALFRDLYKAAYDNRLAKSLGKSGMPKYS